MAVAFAAASIYSAYSSVQSGIAQNTASKQEAELQREQGDIALAEARTNATNEAFNQNLAIGKQRLAFLSNGVTLEGSPAMVQAESQKYGQQQVQSLLDQGAARQKLATQEAIITRGKGRAALIAGISQAVGSVASAGKTGSDAGLFDSKTTSSTITKSQARSEGAIG